MAAVKELEKKSSDKINKDVRAPQPPYDLRSRRDKNKTNSNALRNIISSISAIVEATNMAKTPAWATPLQAKMHKRETAKGIIKYKLTTKLMDCLIWANLRILLLGLSI